MKILHLADLHLGKRVNGFDLLEDQRHILRQVLDLCDTHGVQAVLLAGDIYDTAIPPAEAVLLLDTFLTELTQRGIAVLAISGNHDSAERLDYAARLLARQGVYIAGRFTGEVSCVTLPDAYGSIEFCLLPFVRAATVRHFLAQDAAAIPNYDAALAAALATLPPAGKGARRVLLAHQMVVGGGVAPLCAGSESIAGSVNVGTVEAVDAARFEGFGYVALGHIHRPQRAGRDHVRYAGAPLCYSLDECGAEKSAVLLHFGAAAEPELELLPLRPRRCMRHIEGPLARLTDPATVTGSEDYIWATLTDPLPLPDAMARLRAAYPNTMKLNYAAQGGGVDLATADAGAAALKGKTFETLFADFFARMNDRAMTDAETAALAAMWKEAKP